MLRVEECVEVFAEMASSKTLKKDLLRSVFRGAQSISFLTCWSRRFPANINRTCKSSECLDKSHHLYRHRRPEPAVCSNFCVLKVFRKRSATLLIGVFPEILSARHVHKQSSWNCQRSKCFQHLNALNLPL